MTRRFPKRFMTVAAVALIAVSAVLAVNALAGTARTAAASCYPSALTPFVSGGSGNGRANVTCDAGAPSWSWTIRLTTAGGTILTQSSGGPISGSYSPTTSTVNCSGNSVHTFIYINVGGVGKSDTSANVSC